MKLIEYIPPFLQEIREYKQILNAEQPEIDKMKVQIEKILKEIIVDSANSYGLDRYEEIYDITKENNNGDLEPINKASNGLPFTLNLYDKEEEKSNTEKLEERRKKILSKINNRLPFSLNWLKTKLNNLVGEENYILNIDYDNYNLRLEIYNLYKNIAENLNIELRELLPANLVIEVNLFQSEECKEYIGGFVHSGDYLEIRQVI